VKRFWVAVVVVSLAVLAGCSSASDPSSKDSAGLGEVDGIPIPGPQTSSAIPVIEAPTSCPTTLLAIWSASGVGATSAVQSKRSPHLLTCTYSDAAGHRGACAKAAVLINTDPQAFKTFQRWTVETGQNAMWTHTPSQNPRPVRGIGIEAEWVPASRTFETATMDTWVAVFLTCPVRTARDRPLAIALGKAGLAATS
jgi:hypothetical protein